MSIEPKSAPSLAGVRPRAALRVIGELVVRLAGGHAWDAAAFSSEDEVLFALGSASGEVDVVGLRAELRLQRFAGSVLPHVNVSLTSEDRRSLVVVFGSPADHIVIVRVFRAASAKPYASREGQSLEPFFRQYGEAIVRSLTDDNDNDEADKVAARRVLPIAFIVNATGAVIATIDEGEGEGDASALRTHMLPHDGVVSPVLAPIVNDLLERALAGADAASLTVVLPFAVVRLSPLRRTGAREFFVSVDWLRSRASLEVTAAQYAISKRELQVLSSMLRGSAVATIAAELSISESTVVFHLKRMLKKTSSKNRTELAARMLGWQIPA